MSDADLTGLGRSECMISSLGKVERDLEFT